MRELSMKLDRNAGKRLDCTRLQRKDASMLEESPDAALIEWVRSEGGFVGNVDIEARSDGQRGLFTSDAVSAGEVLLKIPEACVISAEEDTQWGLSLRELLTARLVGAITRGEKGVYLKSLPSNQDLVSDWTAAELELLQSSHMASLARGMLPFLNESNSRVLPFVKADLPTVARAERMVRSRALLVDYGWQYRPTMCMVPLVDLANHRSLTNVAIQPVSLSVEDKAIILVAPVDMRAGEEIFISYRNEGNEKLLLDYGFAELLPPQHLGSEVLRLEYSSIPLVLGSDELDSRTLEILRQELSGEAEVAENIDRQTCTTLLDALKAELKCMPSSEEEDRQQLVDIQGFEVSGGTDVNHRLKNALIFRIGQKSYMKRAISALMKLLVDESSPTTVDVMKALRECRISSS